MILGALAGSVEWGFVASCPARGRPFLGFLIDEGAVCPAGAIVSDSPPCTLAVATTERTSFSFVERALVASGGDDRVDGGVFTDRPSGL